MVWDISWIFDQKWSKCGIFGFKSVLGHSNVDVWSERTRSCSGGGPGGACPPRQQLVGLYLQKYPGYLIKNALDKGYFHFLVQNWPSNTEKVKNSKIVANAHKWSKLVKYDPKAGKMAIFGFNLL